MGYTVERDEHRTYFDKTTNKDKPFFTNLAYFGKIEYAIKYVAERIAKDSVLASPTDVSLREAAELFNKAYKLVADAIEGNFPDYPTKK
jgi:hypothetical protein